MGFVVKVGEVGRERKLLELVSSDLKHGVAMGAEGAGAVDMPQTLGKRA